MTSGVAQPAGAAQRDRLDRVVEELRKVVVEETTALKTGQVVDLTDFNTRKSHGLLELTRALRARGERNATTPAMDKIRDLRQQLVANEALLKVHLEAVQEIADVMTSAISESESDGTYSASIRNVVNAYG